MYFESFLPFIQECGFLEKNKVENINVSEIYCPINTNRTMEDLEKDAVVSSFINSRIFKVYHIIPLGIKVFAENDLLSYYIKQKLEGQFIKADVTYIDYSDIAKRIDVSNGNAYIQKNGASLVQENIITDLFVNSAANGIGINIKNLPETGKAISIPLGDRVSIFSLFEQVSEAVDTAAMFKKFQKDKKISVKTSGMDYIYEWLNGYFQLPEGEEAKDSTGREVVPLLIGPTGVFKSATIKELCGKYGFRLVDFRVAFTSRLDYSGLYQKGVIGGEDFSYSCPMEELTTCSDGFREYCKKAVVKLKDTLVKGYLVTKKSSTGGQVVEETAPLTKEQIGTINTMIAQYNEYTKTPVLFFDEITRNKNKGVEGVLVQILNQKRFNNMTLKGCKFVAATNLNLENEIINEIYDVNTDLDVAFTNRFLPLKVYPKDVADRWMDWANTANSKKGSNNIHPMIIKFLEINKSFVYDESPVLDAYQNSTTGDAVNEAAATPFPNYRTWELISNYIFSRDKVDKKLNRDILKGLIGNKAADILLSYLIKQGYTQEIVDRNTDDIGKFLDSALDAGLPALLIGPSAMGKCVTGDTLIRTDTGLCRIDELEFSDGYLEKIYNIDSISGIEQTTNTYKEWCENVIKISDNYGLDIKGTKNHPLMVLDDIEGAVWKRIEDIKIEDILLSKYINTPELSFDINAYMYGFDLGDGSPYNTRTSLTVGLNPLRIKSLLEDNGYTEIIGKRDKEDNFKGGLDKLGKVFRTYIDTPEEFPERVTKDLYTFAVYNPEWGFVDKDSFPTSGSYNYLYNVIAGYVDSDGYISFNECGGYMEFCCKSEKLITDLHKVLNSLGYFAIRGNQYVPKYDRNYPTLRMNRENSSRFLNDIKDLLVLKKEQVESYIEKYGVNRHYSDLKIPLGSLLRKELQEAISQYIKILGISRDEYRNNYKYRFFDNDFDRYVVSSRKIRWFIKEFNLDIKDLPTISMVIKSRGSKVVKIENIKPQFVYDVTIPTTEAFVANGFISHNTARVNAYCKKIEKLTGNRPEIIHINLASMDNVDVMGMPTKKTLASYVTKDTLSDSSFKYLSNELKDIVEDVRNNSGTGLVDTLTVRSPDMNVKETFKTAIENGRMVILFFDECNRVTNSSLMSAMFEAISDYRIFGIDFRENKDQVRVVAACNLGLGYTGAKGVDAALSARFSIFWKKEYDEKDANSFLEFLKSKMEDGEIDGLLYEYLDSMSKDDLLTYIKKVEERSIENAEPSTRMLFQLSKDIKNMRGSKSASGEYKKSMFNGTILFKTSIENEVFRYTDLLNSPDSDINDLVSKERNLVKYIKSNYKRWECYLRNSKVIFNGESLTCEEIVTMLIEMDDTIFKNLNSVNPENVHDMLVYVHGIIDAMMTMDDKVEGLRKEIMQAYGGVDFAQGFTPYFNDRFGSANDVEITIEMLNDESLINDFFSRQASLMGKKTPDMKVTYFIDLIDQFWGQWKDTLPPLNYAEFFKGIKGSLDTNDSIIMFYKKLGLKQDPFIARAELVDSGEFIKEVLAVYPKRISDAEIASIKAKIGVGGVPGKVTAKRTKLL